MRRIGIQLVKRRYSSRTFVTSVRMENEKSSNPVYKGKLEEHDEFEDKNDGKGSIGETNQQKMPASTDKMTPKPDHGEESYVGHDKLKGKVALITGADSGIGKAAAIAFAREGADVLVSYLKEHDDAEDTKKWIEKTNRRCILVPGDISDEKMCQDLVKRCMEELGGIDILVNNAAYQMTHDKIEDFDSEEFDYTFKTNIYAMFYLCKAALPKMRSGGAIINTTSIQATKPSPDLLAYATTKGAISTFTKALSDLSIKQNIRCNGVAPGPIWTPLIPGSMDEDRVDNFGKKVPMKRPGQPGELAPLYVFLACDDSSYTTGEIIGATGGVPL